MVAPVLRATTKETLGQRERNLGDAQVRVSALVSVHRLIRSGPLAL